jgi:hypothetical protein
MKTLFATLVVLAIMAGCESRGVAIYDTNKTYGGRVMSEMCYDGVVYVLWQHGLSVKFNHDREVVLCPQSKDL